MVLWDEQAARAAEVIWQDAWMAAISHDFSIDQSLWALEGSDSIAVPVDGVLQRMRIVSDKNASGVLREIACVRDNSRGRISRSLLRRCRARSRPS